MNRKRLKEIARELLVGAEVPADLISRYFDVVEVEGDPGLSRLLVDAANIAVDRMCGRDFAIAIASGSLAVLVDGALRKQPCGSPNCVACAKTMPPPKRSDPNVS